MKDKNQRARKICITIPVSSELHERFKRAARERGEMTLAAWGREILAQAAKKAGQ